MQRQARVHQQPEILNPFDVWEQAQVQINHVAAQAQFVARTGILAVNFDAIYNDALVRGEAKLEHLNGRLWLHFDDIYTVNKIHCRHKSRHVARDPLQSCRVLKQARRRTDEEVWHRATNAKSAS